MKQFSHKGGLTKRNIDKIPADKPIIYKIKNLAVGNVYTGIAKKGRVLERLKEHLPGSKDPIPGAKTFSIKQKLSIESAEREEKQIIKDENPKHNEQK